MEREADDKKRAEEQAEIDRQKKELDEREAEQREEAERLEKEKREATERGEAEEKKTREHEELRVAGIRARIDELREFGEYAEGSAALRDAILALDSLQLHKEHFAEMLEQAVAAKIDRLAELKRRLAEAEAAEEQQRLDEEARLPDRDKLVRWCEALDDVLRPEVLNDDAQKVLAKFGGELDKLLSKMYAAIEKL